MAFANKKDAFRDNWFNLDLFLVGTMVWETWVLVELYRTFATVSGGSITKNLQLLRILRLFRLVRVARASRLFQFSPELLVLARGMAAGLRAVAAVLCLLVLIIYVFGVLFTMILQGTDFGAASFSTVPQSMNSLMLQVLCGADADFIKSFLDLNWMYYFIFLCFLCTSNLTLMNMLIGILCDVVTTVSHESKEQTFLVEVENQINKLAKSLDSDKNGGISKHEFDCIIKDPAMTAGFDELGVDIVAVANFAKFIYDQCDEMTYEDFGLMVGHFRGFKMATVKDVMDLRRYMTMELLSLENRLVEVLAVSLDHLRDY
jgi:uncharacterized membrane protein